MEDSPFFERSPGSAARLQQDGSGVLIGLLRKLDKKPGTFLPVIFMVTKHTGHFIRTVKGDPGKFSVVVVGKARRQADPLSGGDIGERCIQVIGMEKFDLSVFDHALLDSLQFRGRVPADEKDPPIQHLLRDPLQARQRVVMPDDQVDMAVKKRGCLYIGKAL